MGLKYGAEWAKLRARRVALGRAYNEPCCLCGGAVRYDLPGTNPAGPTVEHRKPLAFGGDMIVPIDELGIAHKVCQDKQGARISAIKRRGNAVARPEKRVAHDTPIATPPLPNIQGERAAAGGVATPHYFSEPHPNAVDSIAPIWATWLRQEMNFELRPWQYEVFTRALEVDGNGRFVWRDILVTTPRQSGKSFLIWAICLARAQHSDHFSEPQECLHIANNLAAARRIHQRAWRWAQEQGFKTYRAFGQERLIWPDGSHWSISSSNAIWGWSVSQAVVDEAWNVEIDIVDSALKPTLVEREQPQLWLFSTANEHATSLFPVYRGKAIANEPNTLIAEWSAPYDCDFKDPKVWEAASPHWSQQRHDLIASSIHADHFREQWLNIWPNVSPQAQWADRWTTLPLGRPSGPSVGAVEVAFDRSCYGVAIASSEGSRTVIKAEVLNTEGEALAWMHKHQPFAVMIGQSMAARFNGPWQVSPANARTTTSATPWFTAAIRNGGISHNHDPLVKGQISNAVISGYETGPVLTARKSKGPIPAVKAIAWAGAASAEDWFGIESVGRIY